jgi:hypothetical protein
MRTVQTLTKQDMILLHKALFYVMDGHMTYKIATSTKEEIGVIRGESRQCIKSETVNSN